MMLNFKDLSGFTVVVTGACGFIGQELVKGLLESGAAVIAVDKSTIRDGNSFPDHHKPACIFLHGDFIELTDQITSHLDAGSGKNVFVHLAGLSHAGRCQDEPLLAFDANVNLTVKALDFCRNNSIVKFIYPSTALVYGDRKNFPLTEKEEVYPSNIYIATKLSAEAIVNGYAANYGLTCIVMRLSNIYGQSGNEDTVFQVILKQVVNNKGRLVIQDGSPVRDFILIDDVIKALKHLIVYPGGNGYEVFNVSTGTGTQVLQLAQMACDAAGLRNVEIISQHDPAEAKSILIVDNNTLRSKTGWFPEFTIKEGLLKILEKKK